VPVIVTAVIVVLGGALAALLNVLGPAEGGGPTGARVHEEPAVVEHIEGSDIARVTLTDRAAERLDVQTAPTTSTAATADGGAQLVIPYAALIYDAQGGTWAYTSPEPLVFERAAVTVESIDGDRVMLSEGPPAGTEVVVVGAAELFGAEFGVGH
jgi:hypothetical protein